jgi:DUF971 family protein
MVRANPNENMPNPDRPTLNEEKLIAQGLERPITDDQVRPVDLHIDRKEGLKIKWADGTSCQYPLAYLRKRCPCATCRDAREKPAATQSGLSLTILPTGIDRATVFADAHLVGNYAIQITWGDGHSTGIYDFRYLRAIAPVSE